MRCGHFLFALVLLAALLAAACNNPFSTRTPEEPPLNGGAAILPATSPERVLNNLQESFRARSIQDYLDVFSDDFIFSPDPKDSLAWEQDYRSRWTKERESDFALNFFQQAQQDSTFQVQMNTYAPSVYNPGERMYTYYYKLTSGGKTIPEVTIYGWAEFYFRENAEGKWSIMLWVDHWARENSPAGGALRARFS
jgi:hypothetical protein